MTMEAVAANASMARQDNADDDANDFLVVREAGVTIGVVVAVGQTMATKPFGMRTVSMT